MAKASSNEARKLARLSSDCSFLLPHMIRQNDGRTDKESKDILRSILGISEKQPSLNLKAFPVGWYSVANAPIYNPETGKFDGNGNVKAVCFTESTLSGLRAHREVFSVKYGIAFDRDCLFQKGANPCLNVREDLLKSSVPTSGERYPRRLFNFIPVELHPYVNIINQGFDATHEREWRFVGDMKFRLSEIRFIFCPEEEFSIFSSIQKKGMPTLFDLEWLDRI